MQHIKYRLYLMICSCHTWFELLGMACFSLKAQVDIVMFLLFAHPRISTGWT